MIKIEKNTLQQEVWFPRTERGNNTFRKTYQDGFDDGYQDGIASQKVKLYDGMKLAYSTIGNLDDFDFREVKNNSYLFSGCTFTEDYYDLSFDRNDGYILESAKFNSTATVRYTVPEYMNFNDAAVEGCKIFYYTITEPLRTMWNGVMYAYGTFEEFHFNGDVSQSIDFEGAIYLPSVKNLYLNTFDMRGEEKEKTVFKTYGLPNGLENVYLNEDSSRYTLQRITKDLSSLITNPKTVFHFGKERWTYDTIKKEWVLSGYDE